MVLQGLLPVKWMAPEAMFDRKYDVKSDVYVNKTNLAPYKNLVLYLWFLTVVGVLEYSCGKSSLLVVTLTPQFLFPTSSLSSEMVTEWKNPSSPPSSCKLRFVRHVHFDMYTMPF